MEKEAEEVGEAQHGLPVHAIVQLILQQFLPQDHVVPEYVLLLDNTQKHKSPHRPATDRAAPTCRAPGVQEQQLVEREVLTKVSGHNRY